MPRAFCCYFQAVAEFRLAPAESRPSRSRLRLSPPASRNRLDHADEVIHETGPTRRWIGLKKGGAAAGSRLPSRRVLTRSPPLSPRESSKSVSCGPTGGHSPVSSGPPERVRTGRESGLTWRGQCNCAEFRAESRVGARSATRQLC